MEDLLSDFIKSRLTWSFLIGTTGSIAYLAVIFYGLIGSLDARRYMLQHFRYRHTYVTVFAVAVYCALGGAIATIFQMPEEAFVPIQAFILGATWPSIVAQLLSGQQAGPEEEDLEEWRNIAESLGVADTTDAEASVRRTVDAARDLLATIPSDTNDPNGQTEEEDQQE